MRARLLALALLLAVPAHAQKIRVIDDAGRELRLDAPARRIISLAPHITELLFAAGAGNLLVGADEYSDYPPAALKLRRIGRHSSLDLEAILALKPDLVIGWASGNRMPQLQRLEALGIPLYLNEIRRIDDIAATIETIGRLTGSEQAGPAAAQLRKRAAALAERDHPLPALRVFYQIWNQPLMTVNGEHLIPQAITLCSGENVFASLAAIAPTVGVESVLLANPEVIVASGSSAGHPEWLGDWKRWPQLAAVKHGHLFVIPPDLVQRPTPRFLDGAERLCEALDKARGNKPSAR